ncbi:peptidase, C39 family [Neisseria gonorrhoeae]|nr:peptidase, C39 family [Neisseria gonorrhoeae]
MLHRCLTIILLFTEKIKLQSWKARRDFNIVKQDLDFSCGAASVATLLNNFYGQTLTEEEVLEKLGKEQMRASFEDMRRIMPDLGFEAKGYALSFEQLAQLKIPVIVYLKYRKDDHFSGIARSGWQYGFALPTRRRVMFR